MSMSSSRTDLVTVTLVDHLLVADALARIRDRTTPNALFRQNLERIGTLLLARATESLPTVEGTVETPLTTAPARRLAVQPVVVPVLRAEFDRLRAPGVPDAPTHASLVAARDAAEAAPADAVVRADVDTAAAIAPERA